MIPEVRKDLAAMRGYAPGEQPKDIDAWIKLNTNENAYPPSPKCAEALKTFDINKLHLYPNPTADNLRDCIARKFGVTRDHVIVGNGSDDILSISMRVFCNRDDEMCMVTPSYSLYSVLAQLQGAHCRQIQLNADFTLPANIQEQLQGVKLIMIPCPNAPTGLAFPHVALEKIIQSFSGAVLIDEAYVDFAEENAIALFKKYSNVIISRTLSKSYALAGLRVGYALADPEIIQTYMKMKDSYNVGMLPQAIAQAAIEDEAYLQDVCKKIVTQRKITHAFLESLNFNVIPSQTNFLFASPPDGDGKGLYEFLKSHKILVRFFPGESTAPYVRITIGTPEQMAIFNNALKMRY